MGWAADMDGKDWLGVGLVGSIIAAIALASMSQDPGGALTLAGVIAGALGAHHRRIKP